MDSSDLTTYVGATAEDSEFVQQCWDEAYALVSAYVGGNDIPQAVGDRAVLETASELFHRRNAPNGIAQFAAFDGSPVRVARDPMTPAYPLLARVMVVGF
jgi:hypothetical protein